MLNFRFSFSISFLASRIDKMLLFMRVIVGAICKSLLFAIVM